MKKIALAISVSVLAMAAPAVAGDGFYMGLGLGYNDNDHSVKHSLAASGTWFSNVIVIPPNQSNRSAILQAPTTDIGTEAYGAHAMFGYKHHVSEMVYLGAELDAAVFDGETSDTHTQNYPTPPGAFTLTQQFSQQWTSTLRLKLGVHLTPKATVFVTGGGAISDVQLRTTFSDTYPLPQRILASTSVADGLQTGFVYGGGLDWALGGSTSIRFEYLRTDLGSLKNSRTLTFNTGANTPGPEVLTSDADLQTNSFRVGLVWDLNI